jgi:hypothetical protein
MKTGVAVEKLLSYEIHKNKIALGSRINDFLGFSRHFLSPKFLLF